MRLLFSRTGVTKCGDPYYALYLSGLEASAANDKTEDPKAEIGWEEDDGARRSRGPRFGYGVTRVTLAHFDGAQEIHTLSAFPLQYHPESAQVRAMLVSRGRRWAALAGVHHVQYHGTGIRREEDQQGEFRLRRFAVKSRVMIDKGELSLILENICAWSNADTLSRPCRALCEGRARLGTAIPKHTSPAQRWEEWGGVSH